nr:hypothetical protein SEVIR_6G041300v2 [Setaria viridis]
MGIYERQRHMVAAGLWGEPFRPDGDAFVAPLAAAAPVTGVAVDVVVETEAKFALQAQDEAVPPVEEVAPSSDSFGHDDARPRDKTQRRLAQNREAARKSRLRKKAYIQNLETSRLKLAQLEQELTMARRQQVQLRIIQESKHIAGTPARRPIANRRCHCRNSAAAGTRRRRSRVPRATRGPARDGVRAGVRAVGGGAEEAGRGAARCAAVGRAGAPAAAPRRRRGGALRRALRRQVARRPRGRRLRALRRVARPRRALLPLDRRVPALGAPPGPGAAAGPAGGAAGVGGARAAEHGEAAGGRAVAGYEQAAADARRRAPDRRRAGRRRRVRGAADGQRGRQARRPRQLRGPGGSSPAADAAEHEQDPDAAAGGAGAPGAR